MRMSEPNDLTPDDNVPVSAPLRTQTTFERRGFKSRADANASAPVAPPADAAAVKNDGTPTQQGTKKDPKDHSVAATDPLKQHIWDHVAASPMANLWNFQGTHPWLIAKRVAHSFMEDNLLSRAAELGYYFLFALFPTLVSASAILGLVARSASDIYLKLINYMSMVVPPEAMKIVTDTFSQTTTHASSGKVTFGVAAAVWSASVGFTAIQDTLNSVYKVRETRPYWRVKGISILVTILLSLLVTLILSALLLSTFLSHLVRRHFTGTAGWAAGVGIHVAFDILAVFMLIVLFAIIYYFAPDVQNKKWHWLTPGAAIGIVGWILTSLLLRLYLHYFDSYSVTYGSLGAVIILLTWFYLTGLMLLTGAEINSEIEAAAAECRLKAEGAIPETATTDAKAPIPATT